FNFLYQHSLLSTKCVCKCGIQMNLNSNSDSSLPLRFNCSNSKYRSTRTMLAGSFFENSKIDLVDVLKLLYFWSHNFTSKQVFQETKNSKPTISNYCSYCRSICEDSLISKTNEKIGGPGVIVEIDECCFSKRKYNVGRITKNTWVFGGKER